jgi:hypothetical protein
MVESTPSCPGCYHYRCNSCTVEKHKILIRGDDGLYSGIQSSASHGTSSIGLSGSAIADSTVASSAAPDSIRKTELDAIPSTSPVSFETTVRSDVASIGPVASGITELNGLSTTGLASAETKERTTKNSASSVLSQSSELGPRQPGMNFRDFLPSWLGLNKLREAWKSYSTLSENDHEKTVDDLQSESANKS